MRAFRNSWRISIKFGISGLCKKWLDEFNVVSLVVLRIRRVELFSSAGGAARMYLLEKSVIIYAGNWNHCSEVVIIAIQEVGREPCHARYANRTPTAPQAWGTFTDGDIGVSSWCISKNATLSNKPSSNSGLGLNEIAGCTKEGVLHLKAVHCSRRFYTIELVNSSIPYEDVLPVWLCSRE